MTGIAHYWRYVCTLAWRDTRGELAKDEQERLMFETIHSGGAYSSPRPHRVCTLVPGKTRRQAREAAADNSARVWKGRHCVARQRESRGVAGGREIEGPAVHGSSSCRRCACRARACALDRGNALADFEPASARRSVQNTRHRTTSPLAPGAGTRCFVRHTSNFGPRTRHSRQL